MITYNKLRKTVTVNFQDIRTRTYTIMAFTFLTVLVLAVFAIRPVVFKLSDEIGLYNDLQQKDQQVKQNLSDLAQAENVYEGAVKDNINILNTALPRTPETGPLFANINAIAGSHNVEIDSTNFQSTTQITSELQNVDPSLLPHFVGAAPLYFSVSGSGAQSDVAAFVSDLENYPRTFTILNITLSNSYDKTGNVISQQYSILGYVFYLL